MVYWANGSEEIFDFSDDQMTSTKVMKLKQSLNDEFKHIFDLCGNILQSSSDGIVF